MQDHTPLLQPKTGIAQPLPFVVDTRIHTHKHPFCEVRACSCHENKTLIQQYCEQFVENGLMTIAEAMRFMAGRTI